MKKLRDQHFATSIVEGIQIEDMDLHLSSISGDYFVNDGGRLRKVEVWIEDNVLVSWRFPDEEGDI